MASKQKYGIFDDPAIRAGMAVRYNKAGVKVKTFTPDADMTKQQAEERRGRVVKVLTGTGLVEVAWNDGVTTNCGRIYLERV